MISVFFPCTSKKCPWTFLQICPWTFSFCPWTVQKKLPVNPRKCPWTPKKCPWISKVSVYNFTKITEFGLSLGFFMCSRALFFYLYRKSTRELQNVPWTFQNFMTVNYGKVPVKTSKKVPVNKTTNPWTFGTRCPWTQKCAREDLQKSEVHGHFWGSRGKKTLDEYDGIGVNSWPIYIPKAELNPRNCVRVSVFQLDWNENYPPNAENRALGAPDSSLKSFSSRDRQQKYSSKYLYFWNCFLR